MSLQQIKTKMVEEVDSIETETKYLHNFQTELDLLIQEKLAHLDELRQIQNDIMNVRILIFISNELTMWNKLIYDDFLVGKYDQADTRGENESYRVG